MKKPALVAVALLVAIQLTTSYAGSQTIMPKPHCNKGNTVCYAPTGYGCTQWLCTDDMHE